MPVFNNILAGAAGQSGGAADYKIERSLRFHSGDTGFLNFSPSSSGPRTAWTFSAWVKRTKFGVTNQPIFGAQNGSNRESLIAFNSNDSLRFSDTGDDQSTYRVDLHTSMKFRDPSAWYHICVTWAANQYQQDKARIYVNGLEITAFDTETFSLGLHDNSYVNGANVNHYIGKYVNYQNQATYGDMYIAEAHFIAGRSPNTATDDASGSVTGTPNAKYLTEFGEFDEDTGVWNPVEYDGTYGTGGFYLDFSDNSSNATLGTDSSGNNNTWTVNNITGKFTAGKLYKSSTLYTTKSDVTSNATLIDGGSSLSSEYLYFVPSGSETTGLPVFDGGAYESGTNNMDFFWHDGSSWNHVNGSYWDEEATVLTWGTDSTVYQLQSNRDFYVLGGTTNASTPDAWSGSAPSVSSGGKHIDSMLDSPTNYDDGTNIGGNYATLNGLDNPDGFTLSNGALETTINTNTGNSAASSIIMTTGKWYWENTITWNGNDGGATGIIRGGDTNPNYNASNSGVHVGATIFSVDGTITGSQTPTWARHNIPFVIGHALDLDNGNIKFYLNNQLWKTVTLPASTTGWKAHSNYGSSGGSMKCEYNFGARGSFAFTPPTGYKALCTQNLDDPLIAKGSDHFDIETWTGTSDTNSTRSFSNFSFSPDLVWIKDRTDANQHTLYDVLRGASTNSTSNALMSNSDAAEGTLNDNSLYGYLSSFDANGFSVWRGSDGAYVDRTNNAYVAWAWDGGDLATNSAYNQSQAWSSGTSTNPTQGSWANVFANSFSSSWADGTDAWVYNSSATLNFSSALPTGAIQVYATASGASATDCYVSFSDGTNTYTTGNLSGVNHGWVDVANGSSLSGITSVTINSGPSSSEGLSLKAIKVAGKELVDAGLIPVGSLNTAVYDQRTTWSSGLTADDRSFNSSYPATQFFDGNKTTFASTGGSGGGNSSGTVDLGSYFPASNGPYRVEVGCTSANATVTIGGVEHDTADASNPAIRIWTSVASVPSIVMDDQGAFGGSHIIINGKLLVDYGVSVANVPSIPSTVRANPTAGFSIVGFTAPSSSTSSYSVGHGLNATPTFWIWKSRSAAGGWQVYSTALGETNNRLALNSTDGAYSAYPGSATSSIINLSDGPTAAWGGTNIIYAFTPVEGYSAISSYTSTGGDNFIYTGFRPAFLICKKVVNSSDSSYESWIMFDSERGSYNINQESLYANRTYVEGKRGQDGTVTSSDFGVDFLSNGFAFKNNATEYNRADSSTYIYYAVAENPFKYARAR